MARAVGETMAVQMLIGNTPQLITSLFTPTATLTSNIVVEMGNTPFGSVWGNALFLMAFVADSVTGNDSADSPLRAEKGGLT